WGEIGDIRQLGTLGAIAEAIRVRNENHPDHAGKPAANVHHGSHSLHDFCYQLQPRDLVIVSDGSRPRGVWEVVGEYEYAPPSAAPLNYQHQRVARSVELNPDALWHRAGGGCRRGRSTTALSAGVPTASSDFPRPGRPRGRFNGTKSDQPSET